MVEKGVELELEAMKDVATTLDRLDPSQRARVLQWLNARFSEDTNVQVTGATAVPFAAAALRRVPPPAAVTDEQLSVDTLDDLFDPSPANPVPGPAPETVCGMLTEFVAEFQEIAREWNDACEAPADVRQPARTLSVAS